MSPIKYKTNNKNKNIFQILPLKRMQNWKITHSPLIYIKKILINICLYNRYKKNRVIYYWNQSLKTKIKIYIMRI